MRPSIRIHSLLLLFFALACAGPRKLNQEINYSRLKKNNDCNELFKKQALEYRLAVRESKARDRRKKPASTAVKTKVDETSVKRDAPPIDLTINPGVPNVSIVVENQNTIFPVITVPYFQSHTQPRKNMVVNAGLKNKLPSSIIKPSHETAFDSSSMPLFLVGMAGLTGMGLLKLFQSHAQQLSHWAKIHRWKTRAAIGISQIGMGAGSLWLGHYLYESGVMIPDHARLATAGALALAAVFYPNRYYSNGSPAFSYLERKFHDAALFTTGAMLTVYAGNHYQLAVQRVDSIQVVESQKLSKQKILSVDFVNHQISLVKRGFDATLDRHFGDPQKGKTKGEKAALVIIVSLGFAFLTVGVAAISCNLSCSGNEAAAIGVLFAGAALIAWGLSRALKKIHSSPTIQKGTKAKPIPQT